MTTVLTVLLITVSIATVALLLYAIVLCRSIFVRLKVRGSNTPAAQDSEPVNWTAVRTLLEAEQGDLASVRAALQQQIATLLQQISKVDREVAKAIRAQGERRAPTSPNPSLSQQQSALEPQASVVLP